MKPMPAALAKVEHVLALPVDEVVAVLHGRHLEVFRGRLDLLDRDLAEAGVADDPLVEQRGDGRELLVARHLRIDAVELPQVDHVDAETPAAEMGLLDEIFRAADSGPVVRAGAGESALGGDDHAGRVGVKGLVDEEFRDLGAIGIGRIDEIDVRVPAGA